jgi:hypothetical protein
MILFSDRGTPNGYHQMHGYSGHTYKWVKDDGTFVYVQTHVRADGGFKVTILLCSFSRTNANLFIDLVECRSRGALGR